MMTPAQLMAYEFKSAGRNAYKADDVDAFFGEVAVNYERLYRENIELSKRISLLADKLEQYKTDEGEIKQAVVAAQKAANLIVKEAEESVSGAKAEAEAILAAAREEAEAISAEAERQAIADSELLLSISRDKAEEIIAKAKEKAHEIIIEANDAASSTLGAANRTVTSESLHFEMLKKEVSEFKALILSQYKAHIELISKLPEIAVEEAEKLQVEASPLESEEAPQVDEAPCADVGALEFIEADEATDVEVPVEGEEVVQTELPYDFFAEDTPLEFVDEEAAEDEPVVTVDEFEASVDEDEAQPDETDNESNTPDIPISRRFSVDIGRLEEATEDVPVDDASVDGEDDVSSEADDEADYEAETSDDGEYDEDDSEDEEYDGELDGDDDEAEDDEDSDSDDDAPRSTSFFDMFEKVDSEEDEDDDDEDDDKPTRRGFFWRKK